MDNKKILIASSSREEAITSWIINNQLNNEKFDLVFVEDLLKKYNIRDQLDDEKASIQWYENSRLKYSNNTHCLLNRVVYIEEALFGHFKYQDRDYAKREFEAYLGFAFNSFDKVQNIAINGACERVYSLPQQWSLIKKQTGLSIPNYYWGSKNYFPFESNVNIIHSSIYNFLNWSSENKNIQSTGFCFKKPLGEPLFVLVVGNRDLISTEIQLTDRQRSNLDKILNQIKSIFNYFIFELLVFVEKNEFIFGCVNIDIVHFKYSPLFSDFLHDNLVQEFHKCLN